MRVPDSMKNAIRNQTENFFYIVIVTLTAVMLGSMYSFQSSFAEEENSVALGQDSNALDTDFSDVDSEINIIGDDETGGLNDSDPIMVITGQEGNLVSDPN